MDVGAQYSYVVAFRKVLSHYAIINDFEFNLSKSEPSRVTTTCACIDCNWRIHIVAAENSVTFIVRNLQEKCIYLESIEVVTNMLIKDG
jgi:MuDR family transposase